MSAEWWLEPADQRLRLQPCSHVISTEDFPRGDGRRHDRPVACPVCDPLQQGTRDESLALRDGVPASPTQWGATACRDRLELIYGDFVQVQEANVLDHDVQDSPADVGALISSVSSPVCAGAPIWLSDTEAIGLGPKLTAGGPPGCLVLRAAPAGHAVRGGKITLPAATVVMLSGRGARFHDTSFSGGLLVCSGAQHSTTFTGCHFDGCTVYAVHGAAVTLRRCSHRTCRPAAVASGAASTLHLQDCIIEQCFQGITVEHGATAAATDCTLRCAICFIVRHPGSSATCEDSHLRDLTYGLKIDSGRALVRRCTLSCTDLSIPLKVYGNRGSVEVHQSHVCANITAADVTGHAHVLLRESKLQQCLPAATTPAEVADLRSCPLLIARGGEHQGRGRLQVDRCHLLNRVKASSAVLVAEGAAAAFALSCVDSVSNQCAVLARGCASRAVLSHCDVRSAGGEGHAASGPRCMVRVIGGCVSAAEKACFVSFGGSASMRDTVLHGTSHADPNVSLVCVNSDSNAWLSGCTLYHSGSGVTVNAGTAVVRGCDFKPAHKIRRKKRQSARQGCINRGGHLTVVGGTIEACQVAAVMTVSKGSDAALGRSHSYFEGVKFIDNAEALLGADSINFTVVQCEFRMHDAETLRADPLTGEGVIAVQFSKPSAATIQDCIFTGHETDIVCDSEVCVAISGCSFTGLRSSRREVRVNVHGRARIDDCTFAQTHYGVLVLSDSCKVQRCTFRDAYIAAFASGRGRLEVKDSNFSSSVVCVRADKDSQATVDGCDCEVAETGIQVVGAATVAVQHTSVRAGRDDAIGVKVSGRQPEGGIGGARLSAEGVRASGGLCGFSVDVGADAKLRRYSVEGAVVALCALPGGMVQIEDSQISSVQTGVEIPVPDTPAMCPDCGLRGEQAQAAAAWAAAQRPPARRAGVARCLHQGARAEVCLEGVQLRDCRQGLNVSSSGVLTAKQVHITDCTAAICLVRCGRRSSFEGCSVTGGGVPAVQAWLKLGPEEGFDLVEEEVAGIVVHGSESSRATLS